jgi:uncharacterized protein YjbI with pentapeptide repeats
MRSRKTVKNKKTPFTDDQIRIRAYHQWQKHGGRSSVENWDAAIKELETEFRWWKKVWRWTGIGEKKGWDLLPLLFVPLLLAMIGEFAKQREQAIATDKAQQETLVKYLDQMAESIKTDDLLKAKPNKKIFIVAQIRTITALQSLNPDRQRAVIQFLRTANLLNPNYSSLAEAEKKKSKTNSQQQDSHGLFYKAQMWNINLQDAILFCADFRKAELRKADLVGVDLGCADLRGTYFADANLRGAFFHRANLRDAFLLDANLSGANLMGADLRDAYLGGANLSGANLSGANLHGTFLGGANLDGAKLEGANLGGAKLGGAKNIFPRQIQEAKNWKGAMYDPKFIQKLWLDSQP